MGNVLSQVVGESVVKKLPSRRLEAFAGNFSSCARVANSQQQLAAAMEMNEVIATIWEIRAENENEKISKAASLERERAEKRSRKERVVAQFEEKKLQLMPSWLVLWMPS